MNGFEPNQQNSMHPEMVQYQQHNMSDQPPPLISQQPNLSQRGRLDLITTIVRNTPATTDDDISNRKTLYVGRIPPYIGKVTLYKEFSAFGKIVAMSNIQKDRDLPGTCYCHIKFDDVSECSDAIEQAHGACLPTIEVALECQKAADMPKKVPETIASDPYGQSTRAIDYGHKPQGHIPVTQRKNNIDDFILKTQANKRHGATEEYQNTSVLSKRVRRDSTSSTSISQTNCNPGGVTDVLICGVCHTMFDSVRQFADHKSKPCLPKYKCNCVEQQLPPMMTCVVCQRSFQTPWELIVHTHRKHQVEICQEICGDKLRQFEEHLRQARSETPRREIKIDLDNDLLEEEDAY